MAVSFYQALQDIAQDIDTANGDTVVMDVVTPIVATAKSEGKKCVAILEAILANATLTASVETAITTYLRPTAVTETAAYDAYVASRTESGRQDSIIALLEQEQPPFIIINGIDFTFVDRVIAQCGPTEIPVGATLAATLDNINTVLNASAEADVAAATYTDDNATVLTITHDTAGTGGNSFTLVASEGSNGTVSGATLSGGAAAVAATGYFQFTDNPSVDETIIPNGVTFTFKDPSGGPTEISIGATLPDTLNNAVTILNASANGSITVATYSDNDTNRVIVTHDTAGTGGNAYTLNMGTAQGSVSAATLTGGTAAVAATGTITFSANPTPGEL